MSYMVNFIFFQKINEVSNVWKSSEHWENYCNQIATCLVTLLPRLMTFWHEIKKKKNTHIYLIWKTAYISPLPLPLPFANWSYHVSLLVTMPTFLILKAFFSFLIFHFTSISILNYWNFILHSTYFIIELTFMLLLNYSLLSSPPPPFICLSAQFVYKNFVCKFLRDIPFLRLFLNH